MLWKLSYLMHILNKTGVIIHTRRGQIMPLSYKTFLKFRQQRYDSEWIMCFSNKSVAKEEGGGDFSALREIIEI